MNKFLSIVTLSLLFSHFSFSGIFKLVNRDYTGITGISAAIMDDALDALEDEVNKELPGAENQAAYFEGMSNAAAYSSQGTGSAYGAVFDRFLVGATVGIGADLGERSLGDFISGDAKAQELAGVSIQGVLTVGANMGQFFSSSDDDWFQWDRLSLYLSFMTYSQTFSELDLSYTSFGLTGNYRLIEDQSIGAGTMKWTGIDIATGLRYSSLEADAEIRVNDTFDTDISGSSQVATTTYNGLAKINADVGVVSMPIEASTGIRFFHFLKFIGGLGVDLNFGSTSGKGNIDNTSTVNINVSGGGGSASARPEFELSGEEGPAFASLRAFTGVHLEFGVGSVFANVHKSVFDSSIAANAGLNFFW